MHGVIRICFCIENDILSRRKLFDGVILDHDRIDWCSDLYYIKRDRRLIEKRQQEGEKGAL